MQILRDKNNNRIGIIESLGDLLVIRDKNNNRLGSYNPKLDVTYDKNQVRVGSGNLLTTLL